MLPFGAGNDIQPRIVLQSCGFGPFMTGVCGKVAFDHIRSNNDHQ
jgi:hypothetical protein